MRNTRDGGQGLWRVSSLIDRPDGSFAGDGRSILVRFFKMAQYDYPDGVLEWECCIKHPEAGAPRGEVYSGADYSRDG